MDKIASLRNSVNATDKINDIRLSLNTEIGSKIIWILVEGEDDCKVYPKFFDEENTKVEFVNGGKGQLIIALNTLTNETEQVIGIQDADFLHLDKQYPTVKNLFFTDFHDIEITMLNFEDVRCNLLTEYKLQNQADKIWKNVLTEASLIAYIRWYNEENCCKILFSGLGIGNLVDIVNGKISLRYNNILDELNNRSSNKKELLTTENIDNYKQNFQTTDLLNLCNGHDVTALLSLVIGGKVSHVEFCRHLRLSFQMTHFARTKLYTDIYNWQNSHGYKILKSVA